MGVWQSASIAKSYVQFQKVSMVHYGTMWKGNEDSEYSEVTLWTFEVATSNISLQVRGW